MANQVGPAKKSARPRLGAGAAIATIGVKNVKEARKFYENTLGLEPEEVRGGDVVTYTSGATRLYVYQSSYAGSNRATSVTWLSDDVDALVASLKARGVQFERYDMPNMKLEGDVHVSGSMRAAWFKDPDGNILAIVSAG